MNFENEQIRSCIGELRALASRRDSYASEKVARVYRDMDQAIPQIFGEHSSEYEEYKSHRSRHGPPDPQSKVLYPQSQFEASIPMTIDLLEYLMQRHGSQINEAFNGLDLHPRIAAACAAHFQNRQHRSAVVDACLALQDLVKEESGRTDLDGLNLMEVVFSPKNPILAFNAMKSRSDEDVQRGMMHLYQGAWLALRNPRAHTLSPDSSETALDYITFLNLLARWAVNAERAD